MCASKKSFSSTQNDIAPKSGPQMTQLNQSMFHQTCWRNRNGGGLELGETTKAQPSTTRRSLDCEAETMLMLLVASRSICSNSFRKSSDANALHSRAQGPRTCLFFSSSFIPESLWANQLLQIHQTPETC